MTASLPIAKKHHVGAINWGLVMGKTQTNFPWESWQHPYVLEPPPVWFHDVFKPDGTPYREHEAELIRQLTGKSAPAGPTESRQALYNTKTQIIKI